MTLTIISLLTFGCKAQQESASKPISTSAPERIAKLFQGNDVIWGFDFLDEKKIIFTERSGPINILDMTTGKTQSIKNLPKVEQHGQGGMLDVSLHPEFKNNNWVYLSYSVKESDGVETRISRAKLIDNSFQDLQILFTSNSKSNKGEHFGSRIVFDGQGHIFFSVGDRGNRDDAQKLTFANGKIHRLKDDGKIPGDNPFVHQKNSVQSIWSYGHRNPQGLYFDIQTNTLWENEHGPKGGDEINIIQKGKNYGWPLVTYGREYYGPKIGTTEKPGIVQPIYYFIPSIAPSSLTMHQNHLYSGALVLTHLNRVILKDQKFIREERLMESAKERIRNVRSGPEDLLYVSTDSGKIIQIKP